MYCFFLRTGQTFKLSTKPSPFSDLPQLCSTKSEIWPDLIPKMDQILPQMVKLNSEKSLGRSLIPVFVPMVLVEDRLELIELEDLINSKDPEKSGVPFCLVFYPNPQNPPSNLPIVVDYWSNILPMVICRDLSRYFLGIVKDPEIAFFQITNESQAEAWIQRVISGVSENQMYGSPVFHNEIIYLKRVRSR